MSMASRPNRWVWLLGVVIPPILAFWLTWGFFVEIPTLDQWELVPLYQSFQEGELTWSEFARRHNGIHHIEIPKAIHLALAVSSGMTLRLELVAHLILVGLGLWGVLRIQSSSESLIGDWGAVWRVWFSSLVLFSLAQHFNWFWGFAIQNFLVPVCAVWATCVLTPRSEADQRGLGGLLLAGFFCFVATFSKASGLLVWLCVLPLVLQWGLRSRRVLGSLVLWSGMMGLSWFLFFVQFRGLGSGLPETVAQYPLEFLAYPFNILGSGPGYILRFVFPGLSQSLVFAPIGLLLVGSFCFLGVFFVWKAGGRDRTLATPWICLGLFGLLYAVVNTLGRFGLVVHGFMVGAHMSSYVTETAPLTIAVVHLGGLYLRTHSPKAFLPRVARVGAVALAGSFFFSDALVLAETRRLQPKSAAFEKTRCWQFATLLATNNTCMGRVAQSDKVHQLVSMGYRELADPPNFRIDSTRAYGSIGGLRALEMEYGSSDEVLMNGWARMKDVGNPFLYDQKSSEPPAWVALEGRAQIPGDPEGPRTIFLSFGDQPSFFSVAEVDDSEASSAAVGQVNWVAPIPLSWVKPGNDWVRAWVYDGRLNEFVRLPGQRVIPKTWPETSSE